MNTTPGLASVTARSVSLGPAEDDALWAVAMLGSKPSVAIKASAMSALRRTLLMANPFPSRRRGNVASGRAEHRLCSSVVQQLETYRYMDGGVAGRVRAVRTRMDVETRQGDGWDRACPDKESPSPVQPRAARRPAPISRESPRPASLTAATSAVAGPSERSRSTGPTTPIAPAGSPR